MDSNVVEKSSKEIIEDLQRQLTVERNRNRTLVEELKQLRDSHARIQIVTENEEEYITNKFMKYLNQLKKEKEELALKVEQEEEYLTNTLQKKMLLIMKEKVDLENQLEQEEEFIVNKLQKQIQEVMKDKKVLEKRLENEINDHRSLLKLEDEVIVLRDKIKELEGNGANKKEDIDALKAENFVLGQKIIREQEKLSKVNSENTKLMSNLEIDDERNFNTKSKRNRSISFPTSISITTSSTSTLTTSTTSTISSSSNSNSNSNNNSNSNVPSSPLSCSSNSSGGSSNNSSLNNSCNNSCNNNSSSNGCSKLSTGVPITRSRSSSSTSSSNTCLISKVIKEGWMKRKYINSSNQEVLEKRYYEISTSGEMKEYLDETKQIPTSQYVDLDTVYQVDIVGTDQSIHPGYSDIKLQIKTNSISTPSEIITLSTYTDDCVDWKNQISSLMPSKR